MEIVQMGGGSGGSRLGWLSRDQGAGRDMWGPTHGYLGTPKASQEGECHG